MSIQIGDSVTIRRGKNKGKSAAVELIQGDPVATAYVVKLEDGTLTVENAVNVKAPEVPTIGADELAAIFNANSSEWSSDLVQDIEAKLPGFGARIMGALDI